MRWLGRRLVGSAIVLLLALVALPYLAQTRPARDGLLRAVAGDIRGQLSSGGASFGWFSPVEFRDVVLSTPAGEPVARAPLVRGDRPMWKFLLGRRDLGTFRLERPELNIVITPEGSNLREALARRDPDALRPAPPNVAVRAVLVGAVCSFHSGRGAAPWSVEPISLSVGLEPVESRVEALSVPSLVVGPSQVVDHARLSAAMCDDLLQFVAPVVARATDVDGTFSLELDRWELPSDEPRRGHGAGRLRLHAIDLGPGPLVRLLAAALGLPPAVRLADESVVEFALVDDRMHHEHLEFGIGQWRVRTRGSVGFDESLDLVAELPLPETFLARLRIDASNASRATLALPIRGTLSRPEIDAAALGRANVGLGIDALQGLLQRRAEGSGGLLERLLDGVRPPGGLLDEVFDPALWRWLNPAPRPEPPRR